jgi:hypothetical protein
LELVAAIPPDAVAANPDALRPCMLLRAGQIGNASWMRFHRRGSGCHHRWSIVLLHPRRTRRAATASPPATPLRTPEPAASPRGSRDSRRRNRPPGRRRERYISHSWVPSGIQTQLVCPPRRSCDLLARIISQRRGVPALAFVGANHDDRSGECAVQHSSIASIASTAGHPAFGHRAFVKRSDLSSFCLCALRMLQRERALKYG